MPPAQGRQVVDDVDAAAVGADDEVVLGGVDGDIVNRHLGEVLLETRPLPAAV